MNTNAANFAGTQLAGCRCGWLLTYTAALSKDSRHHAASTSTSFASDFRRTRRHPNQPRNFSALRRYVGRIRFFIHSRSQPNNYCSSCRFRTAHRKDHFRRLTLRAAARQEVTPMVEMGGFEPPCAVCAPVSLTHGCSCRELQNAITTLPHLHEGSARLSEPPDLFRASLLPADHRRNYNIEA